MYVYLANPDGDDVTDVATLYSPGNLRVINLRADQHLVAGFTDFGMTLVPCEDIWLSFGHITALSSDLFGETDSYKDWNLAEEYGSGGETYRTYRKEVDVIVTAGDVLETTGGNPGQFAFDFGMVDLRISREKSVANPERYPYSWSLSSVCFLLYYDEGPVLDQMVDLVKRDKVEGEAIPCGSYLQDVPGTAQGNWFLSGTSGKNPEHPHLALAHSNLRPAQAVISMGNSVEGLNSGTHEFLPLEDGLLDRDFKDVSPNGLTYGYEVLRPASLGFVGVIIVRMPDAETLWIEALAGATTNPSSWAFTENKTIFER